MLTVDALREIELEALRPIKAGRLVGEEGHWRFNACVNIGDATELYIDGYRMAALKLVGELGHDQDFLVYPVLFLFRHYLELRLKSIIELGEELSATPAPPLGGHDLRQLWSVAQKHMRREYRDCDDHNEFLADLRATARLIAELVELDPDPSGTTFRYARDRNGAPTIPRHLVRINLQQFTSGMAHLAHFLDGATYGMAAEVELKREFEREYGP